MASLADMIRQNKMQSIPQDKLLGGLSSGLGAVRNFGNKVNVPYFGGMGDMFLGKSPEEIENWSYGNSPFQSTEMGLPQIKKERKQSLVDALSTLAGPVSGLAKATEGLPVGMSIKNVANKNLNAGLLEKYLSTGKLSPQEMAQYEANGSAMETPQLQRYNLGNANAQGGSPESRSKYLYDSLHGGREFKKYDGTTGSAINGFDLSKGGMGSGNRDGKLGVFSTNDPFVASEFAEKRNNPFVMPLKIRMDNPWKPDNYQEISGLIDNHTQFKDSYKFPDGSNIRMVDDVINPEAARKELTDKGFDSVYLKNTTMDSIDKKPINQYVSLDPKNIRSRFAAFDPLRKNSSSLLASLLGGTALVGQYNKEKKMKEMR